MATAELARLRAACAQQWVPSVLLYAGGTFPFTWQDTGPQSLFILQQPVLGKNDSTQRGTHLLSE